MASHYLKKNSKVFYVSYIDEDGQRVNKSSGIRSDAPGAVAKITAYVRDLGKKEALAQVVTGGSGRFDDWVDGFIESFGNAGTRKRYRNAWDHLSFFFQMRGIKRPGDVSYDIIMAYLAFRVDQKLHEKFGRRVGRRNTALLELRFLSRVLTEAYRKGWILSNPAHKLGVKREKSQGKPEITVEMEKKIWRELKSKPQWMSDCFLVGIKQGCRLSEVAVPLDRVNFCEKTILFKTKGSDSWHNAPLHKDIEELAKRRQKEGGKVLVELPKKASNVWQKFFDSIGLPNITFHCTRVTVVTRLARAGFSEVQSMQYVGHASGEVHAIYRRLKAQDVGHLGSVL